MIFHELSCGAPGVVVGYVVMTYVPTECLLARPCLDTLPCMHLCAHTQRWLWSVLQIFASYLFGRLMFLHCLVRGLRCGAGAPPHCVQRQLPWPVYIQGAMSTLLTSRHQRSDSDKD